MSEARARTRERLLDQIALVDALAEYARASTERDLAQALVVRLARRLTEKWELSDPDAVRIAGKEALAALRDVRGASAAEVSKT